MAVALLVEPPNSGSGSLTLFVGLILSVVASVHGAWLAVEGVLTKAIVCFAAIVWGGIGYFGTVFGIGLINFLTLSITA
jgi:hypothetical protein